MIQIEVVNQNAVLQKDPNACWTCGTSADPERCGRTFRVGVPEPTDQRCESCDMERDVLEWMNTGRMGSFLIIHSTLLAYDHQLQRENGTKHPRRKSYVPFGVAKAVRDQSNRIQNALVEFAQATWVEQDVFSLMQDHYSCAFRAQVGNTIIETACGIGRCEFTLRSNSEKNPAFVCALLDASSRDGRAGLGAIFASEEEALDLCSVRPKRSDFKSKR